MLNVHNTEDNKLIIDFERGRLILNLDEARELSEKLRIHLLGLNR